MQVRSVEENKLFFIGIGATLLLLLLSSFPMQNILLMPPAICTIIILSTVPGVLLLSLLEFRPNIKIFLLCAFPASWFCLISIDLLFNMALINTQNEYFSKSWLLITTTVLIIGLSCLNYQRNPSPLPKFTSNLPNLKVVAIGILLVILSVISSYFINNYGTSIIVLFLILLICVFSSLTFLMNTDSFTSCISIYSISLSLLLQNTLRTPILSKFGDTPNEYYLSNLTILHGLWNPQFSTGKNSMLFLTMLYPHLSILSNMSLLNIFQIIYPMILSLLPVSLYLLYKDTLSQRFAVVVSLLFMFIDQYFILLSRSTRSGSALLLIAVYLLIHYNNDQFKPNNSIIKFIMLSLLTLTHYATAFIFVGLLTIVFGLQTLSSIIAKDYRKKDNISIYQILFLLIGVYLWYSITSSGILLKTPTYAMLFAARSFISSFIYESNTTEIVTKNYQSLSSKIIKIEYLSITALSGISLLIGSVNLSVKKRTGEQQAFLHLGLAASCLLLIGFAPISIFKVNRLFMIAAIFILPFTSASLVKIDKFTKNKNIVKTVIIACIWIMLIVNTGLLGATFTNENSHQINLSRNTILKQGSDQDVYRLFSAYFSNYDYQAAMWSSNYGTNRTSIQGTGSPHGLLSYYFYSGYDDESPPGNYEPIRINEINKNTTIYISYFTKKTGLLSTKSRMNGFKRSDFVTLKEYKNGRKVNQIYTNGNSKFLTV